MPDTTPSDTETLEPIVDEENDMTGSAGERALLVRACLADPEGVRAALSAVLEQQPDSEIARAALDLAEAAGRLEAASAGNVSLSAVLSEMATGIVGDGDLEAGAAVMALASRLGASGDAFDKVSADAARQITVQMRKAVTDGDDAMAARLAVTLTGLAPRMSEAWLVAGRMKLKDGNAEAATGLLRKAAELGPTSQNTLLNLARAESAAGEYRPAMLNLFKLLRLSESGDGRYRPLAIIELESLFLALSSAAAKAESAGDDAALAGCFGMMEEISERVSGSIIEFVASARNVARVAIAYARTAHACGRGQRGVMACEAAIEMEPDSASLWSMIGRLRLHYNDTRPAAEAFRQSLEIDPDQPSMLDGMAEALFRDGRIDEALEAAGKAAAASPGNGAIAGRKARIEAVAAASGDETALNGTVRHLAVLGLPYAGGVRLGARLAEQTGGVFVGQSFWLAGQEQAGGEAPKFSSCPACGKPDCSVFSLQFRQDLTGDRSDWYGRIASQAGGKLLISTDNSPQIVRGLDPALNCCAVIAFRSPATSWGAARRFYAAQQRPLPSLLSFLQGWVRIHSAALHEFPMTGERIAVDLDGFSGDGGEAVGALAGRLGGEADTSTAVEHHCFGVSRAEFEGDFYDAATLLEDLTPAERELIDGHQDSIRLHEALKEL